MKRFKVILTVVLAVALGVMSMGIFAGCRKAKLTVNTMFGGADSHEKVLNAIITQFEKDNSAKIENRSGNATNQEWINSFKQDMASTNNVPDVIFYFNGAQMDQFRDLVVTEATIKAEYPDFCKSVKNKDDDAASIEMKLGTQAIMYDDRAFTDADFATVDSLLTAIGADKAAVAAQLPHYWLNHILLSELGSDEYAAFNGTKAYFTQAKKDIWAEALKNTLNTMRTIGFKDTVGHDGIENTFYTGAKKMLVDGSWAASNIDKATVKDNIKVRSFPKVKKTASGTDTESVYVGGITTGWYITKKAWDDPEKRDLAVKFVEANSAVTAINDYCVAGGGIPVTGVALTGAGVGVTAFSTSIPAGSRGIAAIDDRVSPAAKAALLGGFDTTAGAPKYLVQAAEVTDAEALALLNSFIDALA